MKRTIYAALAATVALPMLALPAAAQQDRGHGYGQSGDMLYRWSEQQGAIARPDAYAGRGEAPNPPRTPGRYITDWDQTGQGRDYPEPRYTPDRYATDRHHRGGFDGYDRPGADDRGYGPRYSERPYGGPDRDHDRGWREERGGDPYAGYGRQGGDDHAGYGRDERGVDPYAHHGRDDRDDRMSARMHDEMRARHHGYRDQDFRRDVSQDGRRGYYQDSRYEQMPRGQRRMGRHGDAERAEMRKMRRAMRMIDRFDADKDGRVTQEEVDRYRSDRLSRFDADGDQQLTLDEYAELWADAMRERMVRRFQRHDRDGDGRVTVAEFSAQSGDTVRMRDRDRDGALSEDDFMRPRVEAPLGGSPNRPAEDRVPGDDDRADYDTRPEVEAPMEGTPNEPAGPAAEDEEETTNN